ncbi:hypothetical protein [Sulfitobacter sp. PM12]|uniref:hypothetical protein n=1 Tax=Sulfitobacter sp. PM12 TaxID=3138497 RepID=UPI00388ED89A
MSGGKVKWVAAFAHGGNDVEPSQSGMTLRDYFAAASIQGLRSNPHAWAEMTASEMVEAAWRDADAMIEAREATS